MVNLLAIATAGFISPPGNAPNLVAMATWGFIVPSGGDPGPDPDPTEGPGRVVISVRLNRRAVPALKLEEP